MRWLTTGTRGRSEGRFLLGSSGGVDRRLGATVPGNVNELLLMITSSLGVEIEDRHGDERKGIF